MSVVNLFENVRQFALGVGLMILLPLTISQISDIAFPTPLRKDYVKASSRGKDYQQEQDSYEKVRIPILEKQFYINAGSGLALLFAGTAFSVPSIGTGFILGGLGSLTIGYFYSWEAITKIVRLISLLVAIAILCFAGMKFWKE